MISKSDSAIDEEALISALMTDLTQIDAVVGKVSPRDFESSVLAKTFETLAAMREANDPAGDLVVLLGKLKRTGLPLSDIKRIYEFGVAGTAAHVTYYAERVKRAGVFRRLKMKLASVMDGLDCENVGGTIKQLEDLLQDCQQNESTTLVSLSDAGQQLLDEFNADKGTRPSCYSGLPKVDDNVGGFRPGELIILAARPGIGKTSLAMQFAMYNAGTGRSGLFVSLEMTRTELAGRVFCGLTETDGKHIRNGSLTRNEAEAIQLKVMELRDLQLFIWDPPAANINRIRAVARLAKLRHDIQFLAVDYIGLVDSVEFGMKRHEHIADVSRKLKQLAKELELPVFALSQLNRDADGEEPKLSNLRDSGAIEQDADAIIFLLPTSEAHGNRKADLIVAKHRHGDRCKIALDFNDKKTSFDDGSVPVSVKWAI